MDKRSRSGEILVAVVLWMDEMQFYKKKLRKEQLGVDSNPKLTEKPVKVSMVNHRNEID